MELTENGNFPLFAANRNGKPKFVFIDRQAINGKRRTLFPQTCPSMGLTVCEMNGCRPQRTVAAKRAKYSWKRVLA